jgi:hypothetical protein
MLRFREHLAEFLPKVIADEVLHSMGGGVQVIQRQVEML